MGPKTLTFLTGLFLGISLSLFLTVALHWTIRPAGVSTELINRIATPAVVGLTGTELPASHTDSERGTHAGVAGGLHDVIPAGVRVVAATMAGSGVVIDSSGLVLTSAHVVGDNAEVGVVLDGAGTLRGKVVRVDETRDLALIQLPPGTYPAAPLGTGRDIVLGGPAIALGYPLNMPGPPTVTTGVVSRVFVDADSHREVIQTDAAINLGNSGGPLLDSQGAVIGIITSVIGEYQATPIRGIGFAVSVDTVRRDFLAKVPDSAAPEVHAEAGPD